ncbi:DUF3082 domain-containing protein [filamentous cyanobacterium CCP1]|nr:DUF3082 domain-containing protein [filamentous cyanobacterium CCP2]PSB60279.1 DUF3082 domain-containing protein [filamentous cyanobacterium CCP1]
MSHSPPTPDSSKGSSEGSSLEQPTQAASTEAIESASAKENKTTNPPTPLRCFTGAMIAGGMAFVMYSLTTSIVQTFASKPLPSGNYLATNIAVAVRTLVMGMSALGTGIFGIAALGLAALGVQLLVQQFRQPST